MDKARLDAYQDVTCGQIDKMKAAAGLTGRQVQVTGTKLTWAEENTEAPVCCRRCRNWKRGVCTRGVVRLMPGEILRCALFHEKTHGDEIRGMTDRELALWLSCHCGCVICPIGKDGCDDTDRDHGCPEHLLEWLRAPVGGEE